MRLAAIGLSHRRAPVAVREGVALTQSEVRRVVGELVGCGEGVEEAVVLSTCNRTELYGWVRGVAGSAVLRRELEGWGRARGVEVGAYLEGWEGESAARHLFRVVSGLESMVVGEVQIQGQVREAYRNAREAGGAGAVLSRLFETALWVGGRVRAETGLSEGAASVASAAVELAKKVFGNLRGRRAAVLGAGEMSELALVALAAEGVEGVVVANRTEARARALVARVGGTWGRFEALEELLRSTEIVVAATGAPHAVVTREAVARARRGRSEPLLVVDIALPRDVEPGVGELEGVFLYDLDDLRQIVEGSLARRREEVEAAERLVEGAVGEWGAWVAGRGVVPLIRELRGRAETLRRSEVERALGRLSHLSEADRGVVEALSRQLLQKLLHEPTVRLRRAAGNGNAASLSEAARYLFALDGEGEEDRVERFHGEIEGK